MKWINSPDFRTRHLAARSRNGGPRRQRSWKSRIDTLEEKVLLSGANLVVSSAVAPSNLNSSVTVALEWTVSNRGTESAGASWADSVYLSTDANLSDDDIVFGDGPIAAPRILAPGESYTVDRSFVVPAADSGDYYLFIAADSANAQNEGNEGDNLRAVPVSLAGSSGRLPDLVVSSATAPDSAVPGAVNISFTVKNQGAGATTSFFWTNSVYLSTDATYSFSDTSVASDFRFSPLNVGETVTVNTTANLPSVAAGSYFLLFVADAGHGVTETDETNNARAVAITLTIPPVDLTVTAASAPTSAIAGGTASRILDGTESGNRSDFRVLVRLPLFVVRRQVRFF